MHRVEQVDSEKSFICKETETLLAGMERAGVAMFPIGCRGGGCGICKVKIIEGEIEKETMSRTHVTLNEENDGIVLACRVRPKGNVKISTAIKNKQ
ncbi:2Fe-2S iron-sulfur cluster-binding protein [Desulfitobacterium sp. AusDCA]|uniref:2Fe-2S iron-sulfur cluster-binding protein n=1 Tax=Desulfitobacterium sp. AusDCA TaxID=3240383 RepID=UPI003DA6F223